MRSKEKERTYFTGMFKRRLLSVLLAFTATLCAFAQNKTITGVVVDANGESIIGASVLVKGTTNGIITDIDGKFTLNDVPEAGVIQISYIGYKTQEVSAKNKTSLKVVLTEDTEMLDEVVVVGYGVQKKSDVTGAMIRVSSEELNSRPVANAFEAMQGKAAGVDIVSNERPGEIGTINVRGVRSLSASNTPLYVVDGIPLMSNSGIETLNPQDIESIDVLKDASATAIYGSRGANGVILVTTKSGKEGKMSLNYSGTVTVENLQDYSEMMNSAEYIEWRRWSYYYLNPSKYPRGDQPTKENDYEIFLGASDPYAWKNIEKGWANGSWDGSLVPTTDWTDMVTQTGITHEHTLSASGGTDKMKGYASIGYLNNEGTIKGQSYTRYTTKVSLDMKPVKWLNLGLNINGTFSEQQYGSTASVVGSLLKGLPSNLYAASTSLFPYAVPYDDEGNRIDYPGGDDMVKNIAEEWNLSENERRMFRAIGSFYAQVDLGEIYSPLKGLRYRFNFGPDFRYYRNGTFRDAESVSSQGTNRASLANQSDFSWTLDNLIYYDKSFGKHSLGATLLQSATKYRYEESSMAAENIPLASAKWNALTTDNISLLDDWNSGLIEKQLLSYMFRVNYDYDSRYLLTVSGRWDGASQLADGHKWAFFPSAALGWRLEQEEFLKDVRWINQLKLRLGFGVTGNSAIDPYQTKGAVVPFYYPFGSSLVPGYAASEPLTGSDNVTLANQDLSWEKTLQYNVGVDFSVLDGRISGVVDFYTSRTTDLLMEMTIPSLNGYTNTYANVGKTSNIGVDITLNTVNVKTRDFEWSTSISAAWQKDKIDELSNGKEDDINNNWFIGQALGVIYDYASAGLWKEEDAADMAKFNANGHSFQAGMVRPIDQNGDNKIDPNDDRVIIGHTRPRWTFGMNNTFSYKNFDLSVLLYGRFDYMVDTGGEWQGGRYMQRKINYYNENNKNAEYQKPIYNIGGGDPYYQILGYKNGSFLKVRNISLGYTFPKTLIKKWNLSNLRVYVQAKNPGRIFSNIDFLELDASQAYTSTWNRGFTIGLNVGF
ncbi:SusC/RagA family TonB-linked outer membrane protein [Bacteroides gallinarum]|uniref:SusC/RagA family TonB-linked outer membrane protein n=1 Tax=Bacteroides gallinarum TaxID=376806 RepID=UPI00039DAC6E|nr:TonB-dependent receptor [Bacteroides gallinarum]